MYSDRTGTDKINHPGQNLPDKIPSDKTLGQKPPRTIETDFVQGGFCLHGYFVLGLLKIGGGSEMCDVLSGVPGCVTKCERGRGGKLAKNCVTYFMDGPIASEVASDYLAD